jgi:Questin oxidase-like
MPVEEKAVEALHDPTKFTQFFGKEKYYPDYLVFFAKEMETKGWQNVLNEYLFKGDKRAEDLLVRLHAGKPSHVKEAREEDADNGSKGFYTL